MTTTLNTNAFTANQFKYWLFQSGMSEEEAAQFLNTDVPTVQYYMSGRFVLTERQTAQCRWFLQNKKISQNGSSFSV
jgi:DNA-binding CsgD family transcriptional regulator